MNEGDTTRTLGAVLYDKSELLDLYSPLEMFGHVTPEIRIVTVAERAGPIRSTQGPRTVAEFGFQECPRLDLILLPGGIGTIEQLDNARLIGFLQERSRQAEVTMSVPARVTRSSGCAQA